MLRPPPPLTPPETSNAEVSGMGRRNFLCAVGRCVVDAGVILFDVLCVLLRVEVVVFLLSVGIVAVDLLVVLTDVSCDALALVFIFTVGAVG